MSTAALTAVWITTLSQRRPLSIRALVGPSSASGSGAARCHTSTEHRSSFISCPAPSRLTRLPCAHPTWVRKKRIIHFVHFSEDDGGRWTCFRRDTLTKTGTERGLRETGIRCFSLSRFASSLFLLICFCLVVFYFYFCLFPRVRARQRNVCRIAVRRRGSGPVCQHSGRRFLLR